MKKALLIILPLATLAGGWYLQKQAEVPTQRPPAVTQTPDKSAEPIIRPAPDTVETQTSDLAVSGDNQHNGARSESAASDANDSTVDTASEDDAGDVGVTPLTDDEYANLLVRLKRDPEFLTALLEEYRLNTDPVRAKRLATLFGDLRDPAIVQTAAALVYSGNPDSQRMGLDLLSRLQPYSNEARTIAMELLSSETDPALLVATLNVFASTAKTAGTEQRALLLDNLNLLANHQDSAVRSHSLSLIGRWGDGTDSALLIDGLTDSSSLVRARSASALRNAENPGTPVILGLLAVAENTNEIKTTRQSALYSLKNMPMDDQARSRYEEAVIQVRRRGN